MTEHRMPAERDTGDAGLTEAALARARAGDGDAFSELVAPYRRELQVHCYRILGSLQDAEDLLQETLLAAWRGLDRFEERASLRVWLYRIATNRCLNALRDRGRRPKEQPTMVEPPEPTRLGEPLWLEPYPDVLLEGIGDISLGPEARYEAAEAIALAFVTALQHLPPRQRCVLVLRDVLGLPTDEVAAILDSSETSVKGALQRARSTLRERLGAAPVEQAALPPSRREREIVGPVRDRRGGRRRRSHGGVARRRRLAHDAARAVRVPGPRGHRQVPRRPWTLGAVPTSSSCPPGPTGNPRSVATCPTRTRRSPTRTA